MASRPVFLTLIRNGRHGGGLIFSAQSLSVFKRTGYLSRSLSSTTQSSEFLEESLNSQENDDLRSRIFRLRLPKRSAANVLHRWVSEGNQITISELRQISKELRKSHRYKHALEISEWMISRGEYELSDSDYAIRIDLMTKVFGIDAAERYFEGLPVTAKTSETYTALLHSYAGAKLTGKAEELYERIKESKLSFNALTYNEMMTLYMSVGHVEKVPIVVEELKQQKVEPDIFTYNLWISSCAATLNINDVRRILEEMSCDSSSNEDWMRYIKLTNIYIATGHLVAIPVIDFALFNSGTPDQRSKLVHDLGKACQDWGFFMVINHGVPKSQMKAMIKACGEFFNLTEEEKREFAGKHVLDSIREILSEYSKRTRKLTLDLLEGISVSLGLEDGYMEKAMNLESGLQILAANLYPPCPELEVAMGMPSHSDHGLLTLLIHNGISGLQVQHKGKWINVNSIPNAFVVNIGDHLEIVSNGRCKSVLHRATVNEKATRISIATVYGPSLDTVVSPAPELVNLETNPPAFKGMKYREYLEMQPSNKLDGKSCLHHVRNLAA